MSSVTVTTTPLDVLPGNAGRKTLTIRNASTGGQILYFWLNDSKGLTTTNADYILNPNEEKSFILFFDGPDTTNNVAAIASAAGATLYYAETTDLEGNHNAILPK